MAQKAAKCFHLQESQAVGNVQEIHRQSAFALANAGSNQMAWNMQHGKQFFELQFQVSMKIFLGAVSSCD